MKSYSAYAMRRQKGVAAIEAALIFPVLLTLLTAPIFFGVYFWHYTAVQKSAQNAVRFMVTVPLKEIRNVTPAAQAQAIAETIVREGIADLLPASEPLVTVLCDSERCGDGIPSTVRVAVRVRLKDTFFGVGEIGDYGWLIRADVSMRYAGY